MSMMGLTEDDHMGGLVTRRCAHGDHDSGRYAWGRRRIRRGSRSRRRSVSVKLAGFHVTGPRRGSLGESFISADWIVRVF